MKKKQNPRRSKERKRERENKGRRARNNRLGFVPNQRGRGREEEKERGKEMRGKSTKRKIWDRRKPKEKE